MVFSKYKMVGFSLTLCGSCDNTLYTLYTLYTLVISVEDGFGFVYPFLGGFCWSILWTHLYKLRRTHKRAVVAVVVAVAVAAGRRRHHRHGHHRCQHHRGHRRRHHHRHHRTQVFASGFVEACPDLDQSSPRVPGGAVGPCSPVLQEFVRMSRDSER